MLPLKSVQNRTDILYLFARNVRSDTAEFVYQIFVTAFDVALVLDLGHTLRHKTGDDHGRARSKIERNSDSGGTTIDSDGFSGKSGKF